MTDATVTRTTSMRYRSLDLLRGVAALWVFCFHHQFSEAFRTAMPRVWQFLKQGGLGVPMFFVISGYCLAASARKAMASNETTPSFLRRRFIRIYPPLWFSATLVILLPYALAAMVSLKAGAIVPPPRSPAADLNAWDWLGTATLTRVFAPVGPSLWERFKEVNPVYWTLAIEVQFYCVVALALLARKRFYAVLLGVTVVCLPFTLFSWWVNSGLFLFYWAQFALGIGLYCLLEKGITPDRVFGRASMAVSSAAVLLMTATGVAMVDAVARGWRFSFLDFDLAFASVFAGTLWFGRPLDIELARKLSAPGRIWRIVFAVPLLLGAMSYSLYLTHGVLTAIPETLWKQFRPIGSFGSDLFIIVGTCALCYPFYRFCEAPFMHARPTLVPAGDPCVAAPDPTASNGNVAAGSDSP